MKKKINVKVRKIDFKEIFMSKLLKGLLILSLSVICTLCVVACDSPVIPSPSSVPESQPHVCQFENWQTTKDASCEEDGEETGYCKCGESSVRALPATGHNYQDGAVLSSSTCKEHGLQQVICKNCGGESQKELPLGDHNYELDIVEPTCQKEGKEYKKCTVCNVETDVKVIDKLAHDLVDEVCHSALRTNATCMTALSYWKTCSCCDEISSTEFFKVGEIGDHRLASPFKCVSTYCIDCKKEFEPTKEHSFGEWMEVGASGCSATVVMFHACQDCGYIEDELGLNNAVTHHNIAYEETPATCDVDGSFIVYCTNCDFETVVTYGALGHIYDWVVDGDGHKQVCLRDGCGSIINQGAHVSSGAATCEKDEVCKICNYLMTAKLKHNWSILADKEATCYENGYKNARICLNCNKVTKTTILGGHDFIYVEGYDATCTEDGLKTHKHCNRCLNNYDLLGNLLADVIIPAPGHANFENWLYDSENHYKECSECHERKDIEKHVSSGPATETEAEVCLVCGYEITPKQGHKHTFEATVEAPTCQSMGYTLNTCSSCGYSHKSDYTDKIPHAFGDEYTVQELSCEHDKIVEKECKDCHTKSRRVAEHAPDHNPSNWITEKEATCTTDGVARKYCQREGCGKVLDERKLPKTGHSYDKVDGKEPTCTEGGYAVYECASCKDSYTITYEALEHLGKWKVETEATCTEDGEKVKYCQRAGCGEELDRETISKKGHDHSGEWQTITEATCTEDGIKVKYCNRADCNAEIDRKVDPAKDHNYDSEWQTITEATCEADGLKVQYCNRADCGKKIDEETIPSLGHKDNWSVQKQATCEENGLKVNNCSRAGCGKELGRETISAKGHDYSGEWQTITEATCTVDGEKVQYCNRADCNAEIDRKVDPAKGHDDSGEWQAIIEATCTEDGEKVKYCNRADCDAEIKREVDPAKGHNYDSEWQTITEATCEADGLKVKYCNRAGCGEKIDEETIPALGHKDNWSIQKQETCEADGLKVNHCSREGCGKYLGEQTIPALGHKDNWSVQKQATCEENGLKVNHCSREGCGKYLGEQTIEKHGHDEEWRTEKQATCEEDGLKIKYCKRPGCGQEFDQEVVPKLGHDDTGDWTIIKEATCEQAGYKILKCKNCGDKLQEEDIPALGHDISDGYDYDEFYHYRECGTPGCDYKEGMQQHSYEQELHETVENLGDQIVYTAYIEFICECGYSHSTEPVTNSTHQSIVAIEPIIPTCTEVGYTVGLKCGVEGCDEIYLEPTEIPALGHDMVNGKCLRCGEEEKGDQITIFIEMHFPSGEVWKDYDNTDEGHTLYSYFKTWDMFDEEIADISYLEINGIERDVKDVYTYVLNNEDRFVVKFGKTDTEETPDDSAYIVTYSYKESANIVVYFADRILTVKEFYEYAGINPNIVSSIFVGNAQITDENYSLGQQTEEIVIHLTKAFMPSEFATVEIYTYDENGNEMQTAEFYVSVEQNPVTFNNLAIVFGYKYGKDFIERNEVTKNGEKVQPSEPINDGDCVVVIGRNSSDDEPDIPADYINVGISFESNGVIVYSTELPVPSGISVAELLSMMSDGDQSFLSSIEEVRVNGKKVDEKWILTEKCEVVLVMSAGAPSDECDVMLMGSDNDGNQIYDMRQSVEKGTLVVDALKYVFGLSQEEIDKIKFATINGNEIDIHNAYIEGNTCILYLHINNGGDDTGYPAVSIRLQSGSPDYIHVAMKEETIIMKELLKIAFGESYEFLVSKGTFCLFDGTLLYADSIIRAGQMIYYNNGSNNDEDEPEEFVNISYEATFVDGETFYGEITLRRSVSGVFEFIDKVTEYAPWAPMLFADIASANFNGKEIDIYGFVFEEDGILKLEFATFTSEIENIWVEINLVWADGTYQSQKIQFVKGASFKDLIKWICSYDAWEEIFDDISKVTVNGIVQDKNAYVFHQECGVEIEFSTFVPPAQNWKEVSYVVFDLEENVVLNGSMSTDLTYLGDFIANLGLTDAAIVNIKEVYVDGELIYDYNKYLLESDCMIIIVLDVKQGESNKNVVTIESLDANGNYYGQKLSFEIEGDYITLRELIELNTPFKYEEFLIMEDGRFMHYGEELYAESIISAGATIQFWYNKVVQDQGFIEVYFSSSFYNGNVRVPEGTKLYMLFEDYIPHPFAYMYFYQFVENGDVFINGEKYYDYNGDFYLSSGDNVYYNHKSGMCADGHVWNSDGRCANCGAECPHHTMVDGESCPECGYRPYYYREYRIMLYFGEPGIRDPFYEGGSWSTWTKLESYSLNDFTLNSILASEGTWELQNYISRAYDCGYYFIWTLGGEEVSEDQLIDEDSAIIGVLSRVQNPQAYITVNSADFGQKIYRYDYPVQAYDVFNRFLAENGIERGDFYYTFTGNAVFADGDLAIGECSMTVHEHETLIEYQIIDNNGRGGVKEFYFKATKRPTVRRLAGQLGLSVDEYLAYYENSLLSEEELVYGRVVFIKASEIECPYEVTVIYQSDKYSPKETYKVTYNEVMSLNTLLQMGVHDDKEGIHVELYIDFYRNVCKVNSSLVGADGKDPYYEINNYLIYSSCTIEILPAKLYFVDVQIDNYSYDYFQIASDVNLTGEELVDRLGLSDEKESLIFNIYGATCSYADFSQMILSNGDNEDEQTHLQITKGRVRVWVEITDENDVYLSDTFEAFGKMNLEDLYIIDDYIKDRLSDYVAVVKMPDGSEIAFSENAFPLLFDWDYAEPYDNYYYTDYTVILTSATFRVSLTLDDSYIGEMSIQKDEYTLAQILDMFGEYKVEDYNWTINAFNGEWVDAYGVISRGVTIYGYDARPRVVVNVEGSQYVIHHTRELTLQDVFDEVKAVYGVEFKYDDFAWNYSLNATVAYPGEMSYVYGKILTSVRVTFYCDYGWVYNEWDEYGQSVYVYERDSEWYYPEIDLSGCYNIMCFTGVWEYRGEGETCFVTSVGDLFEIGRENIELYAVVEVDESQLMGTYKLDYNDAVIVVGEGNSVYYRDIHGNSYTTTYQIIPWAGSIAMELELTGLVIEGIFLQDWYKILEDRMFIFVTTPYGQYVFNSPEEYADFAQYYVVTEAYNIYNEDINVAEMSWGNVYYIYMKTAKIY